MTGYEFEQSTGLEMGEPASLVPHFDPDALVIQAASIYPDTQTDMREELLHLISLRTIEATETKKVKNGGSFTVAIARVPHLDQGIVVRSLMMGGVSPALLAAHGVFDQAPEMTEDDSVALWLGKKTYNRKEFLIRLRAAQAPRLDEEGLPDYEEVVFSALVRQIRRT